MNHINALYAKLQETAPDMCAMLHKEYDGLMGDPEELVNLEHDLITYLDCEVPEPIKKEPIYYFGEEPTTGKLGKWNISRFDSVKSSYCTDQTTQPSDDTCPGKP